MNLCDVNVLVYAHRTDSSPDHSRYAEWLTTLATGPSFFALSESVLGRFVRIVTNPRIFRDPTPTAEAFRFCEELRQRPNARILTPGQAHWEIFRGLCQAVDARGKLVADAQHAALAIECGCEWITTDADFSRFPGLRWSHPWRVLV